MNFFFLNVNLFKYLLLYLMSTSLSPGLSTFYYFCKIYRPQLENGHRLNRCWTKNIWSKMIFRTCFICISYMIRALIFLSVIKNDMVIQGVHQCSDSAKLSWHINKWSIMGSVLFSLLNQVVFQLISISKSCSVKKN